MERQKIQMLHRFERFTVNIRAFNQPPACSLSLRFYHFFHCYKGKDITLVPRMSMSDVQKPNPNPNGLRFKIILG